MTHKHVKANPPSADVCAQTTKSGNNTPRNFPPTKETEAATLATATIRLVLAIYDRESTGPRLLILPLRWREGVGTLNLRLELLKGP
jgi:hypothetical protein